MIEPFAQPAWADAHEKFSADVAAGLARLPGWLGRGAKAKAESLTVASKPRTPAS
jgi:hypothetical protein